MKPMPRLLPLVAVAIGGVLAIKVLSDVVAAPQLFSAGGARAEEAPAPSKHAGPLPPNAAAAASPGSVRACAQSPAELAKAAGLSPGELQTLQNLGARRGQIDDRERMLDTQLQLLAAAETKVDAKMKALNGVKAEIKGLLGQADQQEQVEIDRLVTVYGKMKPVDAAAVFATLDDKVRIPVAAKMKPAILAQILSKMPTIEAKKVTESLAHRFAGAQTLSDAADAPPQAAPIAGAAATAADAPAPAKLASAEASLADPATGKAADHDQDAGAKPPIKIHMTVKRPAHPKRLLARPRRDTPTLAAAKAVSPPPHAPPASAPQQTAAVAKPAQTPVAAPRTPSTTPATPAPPGPATPTIG